MKGLIPVILFICCLNSCNTALSISAAENAERAARRAASLAEDNNSELIDLRFALRAHTRECN